MLRIQAAWRTFGVESCAMQRLRALGRFGLFVFLYWLVGEGLNRLLPLIHFPDRAFTWNAILANEFLDFALAAFVAAILALIFRERFSSYGLPLHADVGRLMLKGALWGFVPSLLILIPLFAVGACSFHGLAVHGGQLIFYAIVWAAGMLGVGFAEEFLFRGYAQKTLAEAISFWPAAIFLSALFGFIHFFFKPQEDWIDPTSVALYGIFWCLTLRRTGSLWFAIGFHAASDYADIIVFGEPNTGNQGQPVPGHLLDIRYHGPDWLTGGPRGTEASLLVFVVLGGLFYFFNRAYPAKKLDASAAER
ncbi:Abortive infection protein [Candidatus Koribacter versatilis Ellin345]|uniref:Abortive infection protein n=2 Tax=Candidatus Korobacter versatilis TaxID=658062 RepID=Q1INY0_KORVE|nr:Abortive infection protein [Candidatus Koribacter versatilis Ellin345]